MSPAYGHVTKLFLEWEFQHKGNKQRNAISQQNLAVYLAKTDSENTLQERTNNKLTKLSSLGQEHTFNGSFCSVVAAVLCTFTRFFP